MCALVLHPGDHHVEHHAKRSPDAGTQIDFALEHPMAGGTSTVGLLLDTQASAFGRTGWLQLGSGDGAQSALSSTWAPAPCPSRRPSC